MTYRILTSRHGRDVADTDSQRQDQVNQDSCKDEGRPPETIPVRGATDNRWLMVPGNSLSFGDMAAGRCSCPSRWPHSYVHLGSTNWTQEVYEKQIIKKT